ncbi:MAG: hypothetical protein QY322_03000 [bacterium]|nr:MAG: hypothetical protein QY322_03000 [bacterium]
MASGSNNLSVKYHDIFDYKLTKAEAIRWQYKSQKTVVSGIKNKRRLQREKYSQKKLIIAKKAAKLISKIPSVLFVGITGSLAMMNAGKNSDIDLMIITKKNTLWITRLFVYCLIITSRQSLRRPQIASERDRLCLNIWLDETDLIWVKKDRNIYTAHEIAQIIPLVNKQKTYEMFLRCNRWILDYWPNSVKISSKQYKVYSNQKSSLLTIIEPIAYKLQRLYMSSKLTKEVVTPTRALFHPRNNSKYIDRKLK